MPYTSLMLLHRQRREVLGLHGNRCSCGFVFFPKARICPSCGAKDASTDQKLARTGTVFTYTVEHLYPSPDKPTVMAVVDCDGGGRIFGEVADCEPDEVDVGTRVELTFRLIHEGGGFYNYSWKCRPALKEQR